MSELSWSDYLPTAAEREVTKQSAYEASVVQAILTKTEAPASAAKVRSAGPDSEDQMAGRLTMLGLIRTTGFPIWLLPKKIRWNPQLDDDLERRLSKTEVWAGFREALDDFPDELPYTGVAGVVFPWIHRGKFKVFHNRVPPELGRCGRFYRVGRERKLHFLEDLGDFLLTLGPPTEWQ